MPEAGFQIGHGQMLVCLGDSITEAPDGYVSIMASLIAAAYPERAIGVVNAGISGHKAPDMLARLDRDVVSRRPDWVTVNVGINDVWHGFFDSVRGEPLPAGGGPDGVPLATYERVLAEIVHELQRRTRARLLLVTPTIIGEEPTTVENRMLDGYVAAMDRIGRDTGVPVCRAREAFFDTLRRGRGASRSYSLTTDGVHPNTVGHYVLALTILRSLGFFASLKSP